MKLLNIVFLFFILNLISCGKNNSDSDNSAVTLPATSELQAGTYSIPCFYNKLATQGIGINIYSKSSMTLNSDGTGTNAFELFDDINCTNPLGNGTVTILESETITVDGNNVIRMKQDDGNSVMEIWIGYKLVGSSFYLDVDYTDSESGPYLAEPTPLELSQFMADPAGQGALLQ